MQAYSKQGTADQAEGEGGGGVAAAKDIQGSMRRWVQSQQDDGACNGLRHEQIVVAVVVAAAAVDDVVVLGQIGFARHTQTLEPVVVFGPECLDQRY